MEPLDMLRFCSLPTQPGLQSLQSTTKNPEAIRAVSPTHPLTAEVKPSLQRPTRVVWLESLASTSPPAMRNGGEASCATEIGEPTHFIYYRFLPIKIQAHLGKPKLISLVMEHRQRSTEDNQVLWETEESRHCGVAVVFTEPHL